MLLKANVPRHFFLFLTSFVDPDKDFLLYFKMLYYIKLEFSHLSTQLLKTVLKITANNRLKMHYTKLNPNSFFENSTLSLEQTELFNKTIILAINLWYQNMVLTLTLRQPNENKVLINDQVLYGSFQIYATP